MQTGSLYHLSHFHSFEWSNIHPCIFPFQIYEQLVLNLKFSLNKLRKVLSVCNETMVLFNTMVVFLISYEDYKLCDRFIQHVFICTIFHSFILGETKWHLNILWMKPWSLMNFFWFCCKATWFVLVLTF